jgi:aldehyde:ferredoxin oxidoreductase
MGSKYLKAVLVKGKGRIPLADPDRFKDVNKKIPDIFKEGIRESPLGLTVNGTAGGHSIACCLDKETFQSITPVISAKDKRVGGGALLV